MAPVLSPHMKAIRRMLNLSPLIRALISSTRCGNSFNTMLSVLRSKSSFHFVIVSLISIAHLLLTEQRITDEIAQNYL
ncbi:hypothetical protein T4C_8539 [Trichinella pseudospiralis]|uniref:Uncharacterized protein n=1 Tax=Trichinella pseudospiralis TaxID=6337 RepID=A0A0V1J9H8_TRIPS|nr:hypothetical protein T4C_8539 [Trichinella pseudospiralis]